jgi:hypothetical protein
VYQAWTQGLHLSHSTSPFMWWDFWDRVLTTICPGWLWIAILLVSASWVAGIVAVSRRHLAQYSSF